MSIQDDRTPNYNLALPFGDNFLEDDVIRIRQALVALDTILQAKQAALGFTPENPANKGAAGGYAPLGLDVKIASTYLPSYVDDVVEVATAAALPATGEAGKIYVTLNDNKIFRWSGSIYIEISAAPGTTDAVAEGAVNQYFTAARALAAIPLASGSVAGRIKPGAGFNVSGDGTLTYTGGSGVTAFYTDVVLTISTNGQTAFAVAGGYTPGLLDLYLNGALLLSGDDYTATSGSSLTMATGVSTGDTLVARVWILVSIANAVAKTGGTMTGPLVLPGNAVNPREAVPLQQLSGYRRIQESSALAVSGDSTVDISDIPSWTRRVRISLTGLSLTAADRLAIQLGTPSGLQTSLYSSIYRSYRGDGTSQSSTMTDSCVFGTLYQAGSLLYGELTLTRMLGDVWLIAGTCSVGTNWVNGAGSLDSTANSGTQICNGAVTLVNPLFQFRLRPYDASPTFDSGAVAVFYEG